MDGVATLPASDRRTLFEQTAGHQSLSVTIVAKDFWVCWVLRRLFAFEHPRFLFKGGTSLSKVYGLINRFSEDIDLSIDRRDLGFDGERDPSA